jgi:hypothetical protein
MSRNYFPLVLGLQFRVAAQFGKALKVSDKSSPRIVVRDGQSYHQTSIHAIDLRNNATDPSTARGRQACSVSRSWNSHRAHRALHAPFPTIHSPVPLLQHARQAEGIPRILFVPSIHRSLNQTSYEHTQWCRARRL